MMQTLIDAMATAFRVPGEAVRVLILAVPLPVARGLLLLPPALVLAWLLTIPREELTGPPHGARRVSLRPFAIAALAIQLVLYVLF